MRLRRLRRFNLVRSVSQVNSGARKMVQRHFTRIETPGTMNEPQDQDDFAWVCPKLDTFVLRLKSGFQGPSPRVKDLTLIRSVEIAAVSGVWRLLSGVPPQVQRLLGFPNLRVVTTREVGSRRTRSALSSIGKILPVDVNLFPELRMWLAHGHTLDELCQKWKPFWDRGVRVMINDDPGPDGRHFAVEFLGMPAGLRMRFVDDAY
ncbi:hypothetical protein LZ30DRAFT_733379 [Colletotrichum cereale]|nr:hypothetical protein LZ30DRAFT_733379 [Colletotrichum cereale]